MRRPAPIEKETQGTAKPSLASRCFRQARRPCRQDVDLPRRRRHLLPQSFFSVRHFPGVVNPGGTEPVKKSCGGAENPFDGRKRNGAGHDGAKRAAPAAPGAEGGSRRAAGAVFKTAHRGNGRDCARHQPDARSSFRGHSIPLAERKEPRIRICTPEAGAIGTEAPPAPRRRTRVLRERLSPGKPALPAAGAKAGQEGRHRGRKRNEESGKGANCGFSLRAASPPSRARRGSGKRQRDRTPKSRPFPRPAARIQTARALSADGVWRSGRIGAGEDPGAAARGPRDCRNGGKDNGRKPPEADGAQCKAVCARQRAGEIPAARQEVGWKPSAFYRRIKEPGL